MKTNLLHILITINLLLLWILLPLSPAKAQDSTVLARLQNDNITLSFKDVTTGSKGGINYRLVRITRTKKKVEGSEDDKSIYVSEYYKMDPDKDGVTGNADKCPSTPAKVWIYLGKKDSVQVNIIHDLLIKNEKDTLYVSVDATGCFPDKDGDGVPDFNDLCPDSPKGTVVDKFGCPPADTDGDGIPDYKDKCPDVPGVAKYNGCPPPDRDKDGVPDPEDLCPDVPGVPRNKGCPEIITQQEEDILKEASRVQFVSGSAVIQNEFYTALDKVAELLNKYSHTTLHLEGHTDSDGPDEANMTLSEGRVNAVKDYLVSKGIPAHRITTAWYGETKPVDTNDTPEGKRNNRRVEMNIIGKK